MQTEEKDIPVPEVILLMINWLNYKATEKETALQIEESSNNIAALQGYIAGVRDYKNVLLDSGYALAAKFRTTKEYREPFFYDDGYCDVSINELRDIVADLNDFLDSGDYRAYEKEWNKAVETKKDELFYNSEKGRDLHYCKGWYAGMNQINAWIKQMNSTLEEEEKNLAESLPFDGR